MAFGLVYLHVVSAQKQFEINRLTKLETTAQSDYQQLRIAVETANSPARIMAAAHKLGMLEPSGVTVVKGVAPVTSAGPSGVSEGSTAPSGIADYANDKSNLAGAP